MKIKIGHVIFASMVLLIIMNVIILLTKAEVPNIFDWLIYVGPFPLALIIQWKGNFLLNLIIKIFNTIIKILKLDVKRGLYKKSKVKINAFLLACMGFYITLLGYSGNTTGIIFLCFSVYIYNSEKSLLVIFGLAIIGIALKALFLDLSAAAAINIIIMYALIGSFYYILHIPKRLKLEPNNKIDEITTEILELMMQGLSPKRIQQKMSITITVDAIRKRVQRVQKQFYCNNESQLIIKLIKKGLLCPKLDN